MTKWARDVPKDGLGNYATGLPKAELHVHIEGTLEPERLTKIAERNGLLGELIAGEGLPEGTTAEEYTAHIVGLRQSFEDLGDFLKLYNAATSALRTKRDFSDLMQDYIDRARENGIVYAEIFFDAQTHLRLGVALSDVIDGLHAPLLEASHESGPLRFHGRLIVSLLRDFKIISSDDRTGSPSAEELIHQLRPFVDDGKVIALGMSNYELHSTPAVFASTYDLARDDLKVGHTTCHAGEEGTPEPYLTEAIHDLKVERLDHGVMCLKDEKVMEVIRQKKLPLTVCPTSNMMLRVYERFFAGDNTVPRQIMENDIVVTLNSDDPAYFGGYLAMVFYVSVLTCSFTAAETITLAKASFESSFLSTAEKALYVSLVDSYVEGEGGLEGIDVLLASTEGKDGLPKTLKQRMVRLNGDAKQCDIV